MLGDVKGFASLKWEDVPDGWQAPFRPATKGMFAEWPNIADMFPWQNNGVKAGRTWVVAPEKSSAEKTDRIREVTQQSEGF